MSGAGEGGALPAAEAGAAGNASPSGGAGGGEPDPIDPILTPRWIVFNQPQGLHAYDLTQFPSAQGLVVLGPAGTLLDSGWSADGKRLLHGGTGGVHVRDMSGALPSESMFLADCAAAAVEWKRPFDWIADNKSAVCIRQGTDELVAFDPTTAAPSLHTIDPNVIAYSAAPAGNKLIYMNATGTYVVSIDAGKVSPPQLLGGPDSADVSFPTEHVWSPDGRHLAIRRATPILFDLTGTAPIKHVLTSPTTVTPSARWVGFSADNEFLAFVAAVDRARAADAFYVPLADPSSRVTLSTGLDNTHSVTHATWVSSFPHLVFNVYEETGGTYTSHRAQLDADAPEKSETLAFTVASSASWLRSSQRAVAYHDGSLALLDLGSPNTQPIPLVTPAPQQFQVAASGEVVAFKRDTHTLGAVSVANPAETKDFIINTASGANIDGWRIAPDGSFLAVVDRYSTRRLKLIRLDGANGSAAVAPLEASSQGDISYSFQQGR